MRVHCILGLAASLYLAAATSAVQAAGVQVQVNKGGVEVGVGSKAMTQATAGVTRLKDLNGLRVYNTNHQELGKIEDLVIDPAVGKIRYAVLSFGGVWGMGNKYFAIPWDKLSFVPKGQTSAGTERAAYCILDISRQALKSAPGFDKDHWPDFANANWKALIDQYYRTQRQASAPQNPRR